MVNVKKGDNNFFGLLLLKIPLECLTAYSHKSKYMDNPLPGL